jgi:hypothetical protein
VVDAEPQVKPEKARMIPAARASTKLMENLGLSIIKSCDWNILKIPNF